MTVSGPEFWLAIWDALAEMIANDHYGDYRRRVVNDEILRGSRC